MSTVDDIRPELSFGARRRSDETAYRRLVLLTMPIFMVVAAVYVFAAALGVLRDDGGPISIVGRARAMAHAVIPFVFMG